MLDERTAGLFLEQYMDQSFPPAPDIPFYSEGTHYSDRTNQDDNILTINWADLDEFVRDAQGGPDPML